MKNHLFQKFATLIVISLIVGCTSTTNTLTWDRKNPIESYVGIRDVTLSDSGIISFQIKHYKLLANNAGKTQWFVEGNGNTYHDIEVSWTLNQELKTTFATAGSYGSHDIKAQILKANPKSQIKVICKTCTETNMPRYFQLTSETGVLLRDFTFSKFSGEYKTSMVNPKNNKQILTNSNNQDKSNIQINKVIDDSPDALTCSKLGFKPKTNTHSQCMLELELATRKAYQQQKEYDEQKRQYDEQVAAIQKERDRQRSLKQLELGLRMMSGQPIQDAVRETAGMPPLPKPPGPVNQTIIMPGGRIVNCHTTGTVTNCF